MVDGKECTAVSYACTLSLNFPRLDRDAIFRPFKLRLQIAEILAGFQIGIRFGDR